MASLKNFIAEVLGSAQGAKKTSPAGPVAGSSPQVPEGARLIPREEHGISRRQISDPALQVLNGLHRAGYQAYLVGGSVRDLLLGREPKDFDVCTDARPEEVRKLFRRNARLIGRRFILAHVQFGREIIEVATFRGDAGAASGSTERSATGRILSDNVYGSFQEDARRRDFTANALYYSIASRSIIDFSTGWEDLRAARLRMIGGPEERFREDPVRMLRAIRFSAKLGFQIDEGVAEAMVPCRKLLSEVPPARLYEEILKLFMAGFAQQSFELLRKYHLFDILFPHLEPLLAQPDLQAARELLSLALKGTDDRVAAGKTANPAFLFAALLWPVLQQEKNRIVTEDRPESLALQMAASALLEGHHLQVSIPRRFTLAMRQIWDMQLRLSRRGGRRPYALLAQPGFRAAYDFLLLRQQAGELPGTLGDWWTRFQTAGSEERRLLIEQAREEDQSAEPTLGPLSGKGGRSRRPRRRRGRNRRDGAFRTAGLPDHGSPAGNPPADG